MRDRYSIVVGVLFVIVIAIAVLNKSGDSDEILGLEKQEKHWPLPAFAVPVAAGDLEGDANVDQDDCASLRLPCPAAERRSPACRLTTPETIRVCDLFDRPLLISFWFAKDDGCVAQQDVVNRVYRRYRDRVRFLSLDVQDDRDEVRDLVVERGWTMPVGFDRDGAVAGLFRIAACPTFAYVYPGGTLWRATIGELGAAELGERLDGLLRATREVEAGQAGD